MIVTALDSASRAYRRFADLAGGADPALATRLADWRVGDLVAHVVWGAAMEAAALRVAVGVAQPGLESQPFSETLDGAVANFEAAAQAVTDRGRSGSEPPDPTTIVTLPAGQVPLAYAAALFAFEAVLHASDLEHAMTGIDPQWSEAEVAACEVVLGPMLELLAAAVPATDVAIDLCGGGEPIRLEAAEGSWRRGVPDERDATTTLRGTSQQIVLFATGRVSVGELAVAGERDHATRFKSYFPGP